VNRDEIENLAALARRLCSTPRRVLLAAARMANDDEADARQYLQAIRGNGLLHDEAADECANLLLGSPNSHAHVPLTSALRALWKVAP